MKKLLLPAVTGVVGLLAAVYVGGTVWYSNHFYPNTIINGTAVTQSGIDDAKTEYESFANSYVLNIIERDGKIETISASDINLTFNIENGMEDIKKEQGSADWIFKIFDENSYEMNVNAEYDEELLKNKFDTLELVQNMTEPVNAYINYNENNKVFEIIPENNGTTINKEACFELIKNAVFLLQGEVDIQSTYTSAQITKDDETLNNNCNTMNAYIKPVITYQFGDKTEVVNGDRVKDWLAISTDNTVIFDRLKVDEFVEYLARTYNTFGITRTFNTSYGAPVTVRGGDYGWWLNKRGETDSLVAAIKEGKDIVKEPVYIQKAAQYGENDIGNTYAEVNLTTQHMFMYVNGTKVLESDFVSGRPSNGHATPTGTYSLTYKELDATLNGPGYSTPVKYWMPFNLDVGFHDASWQSSFGGKRYLTHGSHGCINLPVNVAKNLYNYVYKGMPVIVYHMDMSTAVQTTSEASSETTTAVVQTTQVQTTAAQTQQTTQTQTTTAAQIQQTTQAQTTTVAQTQQTTQAQTQSAIQQQTVIVDGHL